VSPTPTFRRVVLAHPAASSGRRRSGCAASRALAVQGHLDRLGGRRRRRQPGLRQHALSRQAGLLRPTRSGPACATGARAGAALRHRRAHARRADRALGEREPETAARHGRTLRRRATPSAAPRAPCISAIPARPCPIPTSAATGPDRTGCTRCGACTTGCSVGAKNTLVKNYLWFAEKLGVDILPDTEVARHRPLDGRWHGRLRRRHAPAGRLVRR
jgi:ferredoxin